MIPPARSVPAAMIAAIASQIFDDATPPLNAGCRTLSTARPNATVRPIDASAYTIEPPTAIRNGPGCVLTYETIRRRPRRNRPRSAISGVST